ncbi:hypothetical protein HBI56_045250 [Parastagonospora nodorum]|nr:hypothetical protein HBH56_058370 [Parastagonospora nodorum]KAH3930687.1 hypothetical protein HBH54_102300 [Parastagonospora nodorum]KAH3943817.1 hypothetical protein HBH53_167150 [Parastagonospora nodorum]KAH4140708.1 hypothetical protein HBH45_079470 [Parastagonospora nodorum]KAH4167991.1 hypothetical protein HBH44_055330 [Parastagonospora nodorum]
MLTAPSNPEHGELSDPSMINAVESKAKLFHGDFVIAGTFDLRSLPKTFYFGMPTWTAQWKTAE